MIRVYLSGEAARSLFYSIERKCGLSSVAMARKLNIGTRTYRDWKNGIYGIPLSVLQQLTERRSITMPSSVLLREEQESKSSAGKKGAQIRNEKHGNPGTQEGRRKGGYASLITHMRRETRFRLAKRFRLPKYSSFLAEFIGAMQGDGGMTKYQIKITLHKIDDKQYAEYLDTLIKKLFFTQPRVTTRRNTRELVLSGVNLVTFLHKNGLVIGNKIKQNIRLPDWIKKNKQFTIACLRGLFDTDGSVYFDLHRIGEKIYRSMNIAYTTYSPRLYDDIQKSLQSLGFDPTVSTKNRVAIRQKEQVDRFFRIIRPRNTKHLRFV